jgi:hypothetical protein
MMMMKTWVGDQRRCAHSSHDSYGRWEKSSLRRALGAAEDPAHSDDTATS